MGGTIYEGRKGESWKRQGDLTSGKGRQSRQSGWAGLRLQCCSEMALARRARVLEHKFPSEDPGGGFQGRSLAEALSQLLSLLQQEMRLGSHTIP